MCNSYNVTFAVTLLRILFGLLTYTLFSTKNFEDFAQGRRVLPYGYLVL